MSQTWVQFEIDYSTKLSLNLTKLEFDYSIKPSLNLTQLNIIVK